MFPMHLSMKDKDSFVDIHSKMFNPKRVKNIEKYGFCDPHSRRKSKKKSNYELIDPILQKTFKILDKHNKTYNKEKTSYFIEFQRRNCFNTSDKTLQPWVWHTDDDGAVTYGVHTVLFYIRKDRGVHGGDLKYKLNSVTKTHEVDEGDILCFQGDIQHCPDPIWGVGCRDLIAVFVKRERE